MDGLDTLTMLSLRVGDGNDRLRLLCLGAHSDDIEIGCAGTLLRWLDDYTRVDVQWVVMCAAGPRGDEARRSADALLNRAASADIVLGDFTDAHLPAEIGRAKAFLSRLRDRFSPDLVLTHRLEDRHQDHRTLAELTWQTWRDHLVLEYEVPKYEGDLGQPNVFVALSEAHQRTKVEHLLSHFGSQRSKDWFSAGTFDALMRLRGVECRAPSGFAEAFHGRKLVIQ